MRQYSRESFIEQCKGFLELAALKALDFTLDFDRYSMEAGIMKYFMTISGQLQKCQLGKYGLFQKVQRNGRTLLYLSNPAAWHILGVRS